MINQDPHWLNQPGNRPETVTMNRCPVSVYPYDCRRLTCEGCTIKAEAIAKENEGGE